MVTLQPGSVNKRDTKDAAFCFCFVTVITFI